MRDELKRFAGGVTGYAVRVWSERRFAIVLAATVAALLGFTYIFISLADEITEGETQQLDEWILLLLRRPHDLATPIGPSWVKGAMLDATSLGSPLILGMFSAAMIGLLFIEGQRRIAWLSTLAIGGGATLSVLLKLVFERERPTIVPHLREVTSMSFPSGHALSSAIVYMTIGVMFARTVKGRWAKAYCYLWGIVLMVLVGVSRVVLGVHYPSDVLGGWIAGLGWGTACWIVAQFVPSRPITTVPPEN